MAEQGKQVKALENRPILLPGLDVYFKAYQDLCSDRQIGMTLGPIPWSSITKWCELYGIHDINDVETCIRYIRKLEQVDNEISERKRVKKDGRR